MQGHWGDLHGGRFGDAEVVVEGAGSKLGFGEAPCCLKHISVKLGRKNSLKVTKII